jgi:diguanylate cyclase (GGDEF)-like protein
MVSEPVLCQHCGASAVAPACPVCGVPYELAAPGATERDLAASGRDQTASDAGQTVADHDQTLADRDQSGSDADQRSADDDQDAADEDLAAGTSDENTHRRTSRARDRTSQDRKTVSQMRDRDAEERLTTASNRDRIAEGRDRDASARDVRSHSLSLGGDADTSRQDMVLRAERDRSLAAIDRARAGDDRHAAALDREASANERADSSRLRSEIAVELKAAATDQLTGAWTRRFGLEQVSREIERASRAGTSLLLAFVDVDGLKQVNDTSGHLAGDELLRAVGAMLRRHLRPYDVTVRYGGDEFICAMPSVEPKDAKARFKSVANALDGMHTFTIGIASSEPGDTLDSLIARADAALLAARRG